jgi:methyltransferase
MLFLIFISFIILQRILELLISGKNEIWLRSKGAIEYGQGHYPFIILLHVSFLVSLVVEYVFRNQPPLDIFYILIYLILIVAKTWLVSSLGKYWNTKIFRIRGNPPVKKGLYKYFKHPNYFIVVCEIIVIPMILDLYYTACLFTVLNAVILTVRIRDENRVWVK